MHKSIRVATLATAAVLALGATAPSSLAAPHAQGSHKHSAAAHGKSGHGKSAAAQRRIDRAQATLARQAAHTERLIAHHTRDGRFHGISEESRTAVQGNAAQDVADLKDLADQAAEAGSLDALRALAKQVRAYHPHGYVVLENRLRRAAELQTQIDAATDAATVADASDSVASAVEKALGYHCSDDLSVLREIQADLKAAVDSLDAVEAPADGSTDGSTDPSAPAA